MPIKNLYEGMRGGNNAWVGIALAQFAAETGESCYLVPFSLTVQSTHLGGGERYPHRPKEGWQLQRQALGIHGQAQDRSF